MFQQHRLTTILMMVFAPALLLLFSMFTMLQISQAGGTVLCVVPNDTSTGPFAACSDVFTNVQAAIDDASGGEEIWVASGVYTDVHVTGTMPQVAYLDKALTLLGGFVPPFDASPDPVSNPTVLDAERKGRVIVVVETAVTIQGFHITGGNGNQDTSSLTTGKGGGIFATNATVTITENSIYSNIGALYDGEGGGVFIEDSQFTITGNDVYSNTAVISSNPPHNNEEIGSGGGIAIGNSVGVLHGNTIRNNVANAYMIGQGGGIYLSGSSHVTLTNNDIIENVGSRQDLGFGGGVSWHYDEYVDVSLPKGLIANNVISGNIAAEVSGSSGEGGGIAFLLRGLPTHTDPIISLVSNDIISNTGVFSATQSDISSVGGHGGGIFLASEGHFAFSHNRILSNTATAKPTNETWSMGGGLIMGEANVTFDGDRFQFNQLGFRGAGNGILLDNCVLTMTNVVVADNLAQTGGEGIILHNSQVTMKHPTIARNGARGIWIYYPEDYMEPDLSSQVAITNAILAGHTTGIVVSSTNTVTVNGVLWHDTSVAFSAEPGATVSISNQVVGDPRFAADGFHLTEDSAAIGQGVLTEVSTDIDGDGRPSPPALGADEYMPFKLLLPLVLKE